MTAGRMINFVHTKIRVLNYIPGLLLAQWARFHAPKRVRFVPMQDRCTQLYQNISQSYVPVKDEHLLSKYTT